MARNKTLGTILTLCKQRYSSEGDELLDVPELKSLIDEYYGQLHALVVEKGARYFETEATITATGTASYALPADHMSTIAIDFVIDATRRRPVCGPIPVQRREQLLGSVGDATEYELAGSNIALYPNPPSGTYKHLYVPQPVDLSTAADSTVVDLINIYGQAFVVWGVASVAKHKAESDQQRAIGEHAKAAAQLEYWASLRALNETASPHPHRAVYQDRRDTDPASYRVTPA
jgi:hypothetical protein